MSVTKLNTIIELLGTKPPRWRFILDNLCKPENGTYPHVTMLEDNSDLAHWLIEQLSEYLNLPESSDAYGDIIQFLTTDAGPLDVYEVSVIFTVDATSPQVACEQVVQILREKFEDNTESLVLLVDNTRTNQTATMEIDI